MARSHLPVGTVRGMMLLGVSCVQPKGLRFDTGNWLMTAEYVYSNNYPLKLSFRFSYWFLGTVLESQIKRGIPPPLNPAADKSGRALRIAISRGSQRAGMELGPGLKGDACQKIKQWMPSCLILTF